MILVDFGLCIPDFATVTTWFRYSVVMSVYIDTNSHIRHWAGPTEAALQTLLGAAHLTAHTPASDRQGLYITVLT
jgi:hypothetical protein